jgi:hypothetical protein
MRVVGVVLELTVAATSCEDLVLPSGSVQSIEIVFEYQSLSWSAETAPRGDLDVG